MSSNDWQISTAGGTVTGTEEYVRATGTMLDALEPPIPFRIIPPLPTAAARMTKAEARQIIEEARDTAWQEHRQFRAEWAADHGANVYVWSEEAKNVHRAYQSVRDLANLRRSAWSAERTRGLAAKVTAELAAARAARAALTA